MSRKGSDFPKVELLESCKKWQKSFFYVRNTTDVDLLNLPPFVDVPPLAMKNWTYNPKSSVTAVNGLDRVKVDLRDAGLTPQDLVACFISQRISSLQRRSHKICQMSGPMDPTRHSTHELAPADILRWVKDICKSSQATSAWGLEPYSRDRPAPTVNRSGRYITSYLACRYLSRHMFISRYLLCLARDIVIADILIMLDPIYLLLRRISCI
jgi:hypothetical protein